MAIDWHRNDRIRRCLAAGLWLAAALFYVGSELAAASVFSPPYSYAHNYVSDLGVAVCGTIYEGGAICSPLHGLMNGDFIVQGLLFPGAAVALVWSIPTAARLAFVVAATLNGVGNALLGSFPENMPGQFSSTMSCHVLGALLAIVFGNATALISVSVARSLGLPRLHRHASVVLPFTAAVSLAMLVGARRSGTMNVLPDAVWERASVYTITGWEALTAICLLVRTRHRSPRSLPRSS